MSAELPLSTRIRLVLNLSITSMMTRGSSCGCFTPLASSSKNRMSIFVCLLCFKGCIPWMLFTSLCWDFLRDLKNPPMDGPLAIVFISLITFYGWLYDLSSSIGGFSNFSLQSSLDQLDSPLFTILQLTFPDQFFYLFIQVFAILNNGCDLYGNGNFSSCLIYWARNEVVPATWGDDLP